MQQKFVNIFQVAVFSLVLSVGVGTALADWTQPSAVPPDNNTPSPVNVGIATQIKNGNLFLGTGKTFSATLGLFGQIGIGTTEPTVALDVNGKIKSLSTVASDVGTTVVTKDYVDTHSSAGFWAVSGNNISNTNTGNVGIGKTNPAVKLDVNGKIRSQSTGNTDSGTTVATKDYVDAHSGGGGVGIGGSNPVWHNVGASRKFSHHDNPTRQNTFTNSHAYPIMVNASTYSGPLGTACSIWFTIDGVDRMGWNFLHGSPGAEMCSSEIVIPAGSTYKVHSLAWAAVGGPAADVLGNPIGCAPMVEGKQVCGGRNMWGVV